MAAESRSERSRGRVKRPMNSFLLFSNEMRPILQAAHPDHSNAEISTLLGNQWKDLDSEKRQRYVDAAQAIRTTFNEAHPNFVYTKTSRRDRKRKRAEERQSKTRETQFHVYQPQTQHPSPLPLIENSATPSASNQFPRTNAHSDATQRLTFQASMLFAEPTTRRDEVPISELQMLPALDATSDIPDPPFFPMSSYYLYSISNPFASDSSPLLEETPLMQPWEL